MRIFVWMRKVVVCEVLAVVDDIIEGTTTGFESFNDNGDEIVIFLDVLGYVGGYPAVSHTLDVLGHSSNVPCHLCTYTRYDRSGAEGRKYGYTTNIHTDHPSFAKSENRSNALRAAELSTADLQFLVMHDEDTFEIRSQVLHQLASKLAAVRNHVPRTMGGNVSVVPAVFDSYRSCVVAPDHFFLRPGCDIMNMCVTLFPPRVRRDAGVLAKEALRENGLT